jgi:hypothetical protein
MSETRRVAPQVGHPTTISMAVDQQAGLAEQAVNDDLAQSAIDADCREHRATRRTEK